MSTTITLPALDDPAAEFVIEHIYVAPDDKIAAAQPLVLVRSDHFAWDIPASVSGTISAIMANEDQAIAVGAPLVEVQDAEGETRKAGSETRDAESEAQDTETVESDQVQSSVRVRATPLARTIAATHDLDLATISGTGYGGCVTRADVVAVIRDRGLEVGGWRSGSRTDNQEPSTIQRSNLPTALTAVEVDMSTALATIRQQQARVARRGVQVNVMACVGAATAAALGEHRSINSAWSNDGIILHSRVHLQVKCAGAEQATVIEDAAEYNMIGLARRLLQPDNDHADGAAPTLVIEERRGPWWGDALLDGSIAAVLSVGEVRHEPRVLETPAGDHVAVRPTLVLTLTYDARVVTQDQADAFLVAIKRRLEHSRGL